MTIISRSIDDATSTPDLILPFEGSDDPQTVLHDVLGRPSGIPDVTLAPALSPAGTIRAFYMTHADAEACRALHRAPAVFYIDDGPAWLPTAYVPNGPIRAAQQDPQISRWIVEIPFRSVGEP